MTDSLQVAIVGTIGTIVASMVTALAPLFFNRTVDQVEAPASRSKWPVFVVCLALGLSITALVATMYPHHVQIVAARLIKRPELPSDGSGWTRRVNYDHIDIDTESGIVTGDSWNFTAVKSGLYQVNASLHLGSRGKAADYCSFHLERERDSVELSAFSSYAPGRDPTFSTGNVVLLRAGDRVYAEFAKAGGPPLDFESGSFSAYFLRSADAP